MTEQWQASKDLFSLVNMRRLKETRNFCLGLVMTICSATIILPSQCHVKEFLGGLFVSQFHIKEILGGTQEQCGVVDEAREEDLPAAGDLCGVAVRLGHPWRCLDQVVLEWGDVQSWSLSICAKYYISFPNYKHR